MARHLLKHIFYISSLDLTSNELLNYARAEWSVESMHWILDVNLLEYKRRINSETSQKSLNILRKLSLNLINTFQEKSSKKTSESKVMLNYLLDANYLLNVIGL